MSGHDEAFAKFRERKRAAEAERDRGRVTWRRVSRDTGGGYSGIGSGGRLVYVVRSEPWPEWTYGVVEDGVRRSVGTRPTVAEAKAAAAALLGADT